MLPGDWVSLVWPDNPKRIAGMICVETGQIYIGAVILGMPILLELAIQHKSALISNGLVYFDFDCLCSLEPEGSPFRNALTEWETAFKAKRLSRLN